MDNSKERISCAEEIWRHATRAAEWKGRRYVRGSLLQENLLLELIPNRSRAAVQSVSKPRSALAK